MKLFEAIEKYGKGDGVVLTLNEISFTPYYQVGSKWYGTNEIGQSIHWLNDCSDGWELYQEPVEMEDRWLWATDLGSVSSAMHSGRPGNTKYHIKLEWSRTSFPKEKS